MSDDANESAEDCVANIKEVLGEIEAGKDESVTPLDDRRGILQRTIISSGNWMVTGQDWFVTASIRSSEITAQVKKLLQQQGIEYKEPEQNLLWVLPRGNLRRRPDELPG